MHICFFPEAGELHRRKDFLEEVAANLTCAMFETTQGVLHGARHMVFNSPTILPLFVLHTTC
jgi:transcription elongation factor SPT6